MKKKSKSQGFELNQYGQTRTLADIVKALNDEHQYTSLDALREDLGAVIESYLKRGTIDIDVYKDFLHCLLHYELELFISPSTAIGDIRQNDESDGITQIEKNDHAPHCNRILKLEILNEIIDSRSAMHDSPLDAIHAKRVFAKLCGIIQYLNDFRRYTNIDELLNDLKCLCGAGASSNAEYNFDDSEVYPYFIWGLSELWEDIAPNGALDNGLLEKFMFTNHAEAIEELGIEKTLEEYYISNEPCHPEVYFPRRGGTGPVYVKHSEGKYVKSWGEGKGPSRWPELNEMELIEPILAKDANYQYISGYYIPRYDSSLPIYGNSWEYMGKLEFENETEKRRFISNLRRPSRR